MTSANNNFSYFSQNQLSKFSAFSLNNKTNKSGKTNFKVKVQIICEQSKQKKIWTVARRTATLTLEIPEGVWTR